MERTVDDFIRRRNERAAATPNPLDPPAGQAQRREDDEQGDPVEAYIAERNKRADEAPNPLAPIPEPH